jgi:hypothetical protein
MLNPAIYRAGLIPALLAVIIAAFSLSEPPKGVSTILAPDAFNGPRAAAVLQDLVRSYPSRRPGSAGDDRLAGEIEATLRRRGYRVAVRSFAGDTVDGERTLKTVVARRAGSSPGQIVVLTSRDALQPGSTAQLSGTAALLELARVFEGRRLERTITLVSTSGGSGGAAGANEFARHPGGPVVAVLVAGDVAGRTVRKPVVVPWANAPVVAPLQLRRTVESALRLETGSAPGDARGFSQFTRLALPFTVGEQGEVLARGLPAVLVQASGERGPGGERSIDPERLTNYGRALLRSITAIDAAPANVGRPGAAILIRTKQLPEWAVRLLVIGLMLPVLLAAVDGAARARRRGDRVLAWVGWTLAGAAPFVIALAFAWILELTGLLPAGLSAPAPAGAEPVDGAAAAAMAATLLVLVAAWAGLRPLLLRAAGTRGAPAPAGAAAGLMVVLCVIALVVWALNPFAAALLVLPLHAWLFVAAPEVRTGRAASAALVLFSLLPLAAVLASVLSAQGFGPLEAGWEGLLLVVGGFVGPAGSVVWCALGGVVASLAELVRARAALARDAAPPTTRGPSSYAGPGSLGGTESALRR